MYFFLLIKRGQQTFWTHCMSEHKLCLWLARLDYSAKKSKGEHALVLLSLTTHNLQGHMCSKVRNNKKITHTMGEIPDLLQIKPTLCQASCTIIFHLYTYTCFSFKTRHSRQSSFSPIFSFWDHFLLWPITFFKSSW